MPAENKILVAYFSISGVTRSVATEVAAKQYATTVEIKPLRNGMFYLFTTTLFGRPARIQKIDDNIGEYDLVIVATPVWSASVPSPVRAFLTTIKDQCERVAFVCTQNSEGAEDVLEKMAKIADKNPIDTLILSKTDLDEDSISDPLVTRFCSSCLSSLEATRDSLSYTTSGEAEDQLAPVTTPIQT